MEVNEQQKKIFTKLKFVKSEQTGAYIGFVSKNPKTGKMSGVRQNSEFPKKIVIVDKKIANLIIDEVLYNAAIIPMKEKNGYIAVEATPVSFKATLEITYVPKAIYKIEIKFGGKTALFDPVDGKKETVRTVSGVREFLEKRMDIENLQQVIDDFNEAADNLMKRYDSDNIQFNSRKGRL